MEAEHLALDLASEERLGTRIIVGNAYVGQANMIYLNSLQ